MKIKALVNFYTNVLAEVGVVDGGEGKLSYLRGDVKAPVTLEHKRLCLPTRENLKELNLDTNIVFHPTAEQVTSGPSPVLNALRDYISLRLTTTGMAIATGIAELATEPKRQAKLGSGAKDVLKGMSKADPKTVDVLNSVLSKVGESTSDRMYNLFLKNRGSKADPKGLRTTSVSFPIMDDAYNEDREMFFGTKMARKTIDKAAIVALLEYVLDYPTGEENYVKEFTTSDHQAPYLRTLLTAFRDIAEHQNKIIKVFSKHIPNLADLEYNLDWTEELDDFVNFVDKVGVAVPLLPGNSGKVVRNGEEPSDTDETKSMSWSDIKDDIKDDEPQVNLRMDLDRKPASTGKKDWRSLLQDSGEKDRDEGLSFGRRSRKRTSGFDSLGHEEDDRRSRRDERDPYGRESRRGRGPTSFRDIMSTSRRGRW